ncbi:MAG: RHS repeat-associated core domain-containing protein [Pirellulales bacterium]
MTVSDALSGPTTLLYNDFGDLAEARDPLGRVSQYRYDSLGNLTTSVTPAGTSTAFEYDAHGNLVQSTNALGNTRTLSYDERFEALSQLRDARGNALEYRYDGEGNLIAIAYADGSAEQFSYDALGNLLEAVNRRGDAIGYSYDSRGLVTRKEFDDGRLVDYTYDARGNLLTASDVTGTTALADDAADRLTKITYPSGRSLEFTYDENGRRTRSVDQHGFTVNYEYDAGGRLSRLADGSGGTIVGYTYDEAGRLSRKELGNGTFTTYEYDLAGQLAHLVNHAPGGAVNSRFDYTYSLLGQVTSIATLEGVTTYGYDATAQLTSVTLPGGRTIQYRYDAEGNRTSVVDAAASTAYQTNDLNQYTAVGNETLTYDADGNLIAQSDGAGTTNYTYDDENRLLSVTRGADTWVYEYDVFGNRVAEVHNGLRTEYLVDPAGLGDVVAEFDASGAVVARYTHGLGLVSRVDTAGADAYYDFDHTGSTVGLTSDAGGYVNRYSYLPFGETTTVAAAVPNPFAYIGEYGVRTAGSGLLHMRARDYDPVTGRFISDDPIGLAGGDSNLRRYVGNDPVNRIDPSGLKSNCTELEKQRARLEQDFQDESDKYYEYMRPVEEAGDDDGDVARALFQTLGGEILFALIGAQFRETKREFGLGRDSDVSDADQRRDFQKINNRLYEIVDELHRINNQINSGKCDPDKPAARMAPHGSTGKPPPAAPLPPTGVPPATETGQSRKARAIDPNDITGPAGFGEQNFIQLEGVWPDTIRFENDPLKATAPAQEVFITHQLDADLDWSSFELSEIGFGSQIVTVPAGVQSYETRVEYQNPDGSPLLVDVAAALDLQMGVVTWTFRSVDPATGTFPEEVFAGFLPVNDGSGRGEGFVFYTIEPRSNLTTGTTVDQQASIVFDFNEPLVTNTFTNSIDIGSPTSSVASFDGPRSSTTFTVSWSGTDDNAGSGIASFDIFVSENGGEFTLFQDNTTATSAQFTGAPGSTYSFYSVATDNVGHVELAPARPDAQTTVDVTAQPQLTVSAINGPTVAVPGQLRSYFVTFTDTAAAGTHTATIDWGDGTVQNAFVGETTNGSTTAGTISFWHTYAGFGDFRPRLTVSDSQNNQTVVDGFVTVQTITLQPDPHDANKTALVVGGLAAVDDLILFEPEPNGARVRLYYNGSDMGSFNFNGSIAAYGQTGDDLIQVSPFLGVPALLFGQEGNDILVGGAANDILVGSLGDDILYGSGGRDLLFGGLGADYLQGSDFSGASPGDDSDLLLADFSVFDYDIAFLAGVYQSWTRVDTYSNRVAGLRTASLPLRLDATTIFNDFSLDRLFGGSSEDWLLHRIGHDFAGDMQVGEEVS